MIEAIQNHKFVENSIQINQKLFLASPVKFSKYGWEYLFLSTPVFVSETSRPYFINKKVYSEDSGKRIANQNVINQMERSTGMDYFLTA